MPIPPATPSTRFATCSTRVIRMVAPIRHRRVCLRCGCRTTLRIAVCNTVRSGAWTGVARCSSSTRTPPVSRPASSLASSTSSSPAAVAPLEPVAYCVHCSRARQTNGSYSTGRPGRAASSRPSSPLSTTTLQTATRRRRTSWWTPYPLRRTTSTRTLITIWRTRPSGGPFSALRSAAVFPSTVRRAFRARSCLTTRSFRKRGSTIPPLTLPSR
mmetsp:Transcript_24814/g.69514  ORF Transcript_24814/g.69514 Transcript_24814/m.69514 type:complete len:214 (-) Transcript_24814:1981-2622(-)